MALITNDDVSVHEDFAARENIAFTLLADKKADIIGAFGLLNPNYAKGTPWHGIALPAIFAIDPKGVVTHRFTTTNYRDRPEPQAVLKILGRKSGS